MLCDAPSLSVQILSGYNREEYTWTEGLQWYNGYLYESTGSASGRSGRGSDTLETTVLSYLQQLSLGEGQVKVEARLPLPSKYFGEGLARDGDKLYQLTEDFAAVFEYGLEPLSRPTKLLHVTTKVGQRWGLCFDSGSNQFYLSDGNDTLWIYNQFADILNNEPAGKIEITCNKSPLPPGYFLNDLEFANGYIYAAVWLWQGDDSALILKIDPETSNVEAKIDAKNLREEQGNPNARDLNGIAYCYTDTDGQDVFLVTGKLWSKIFAVKFFPEKDET